MEKPFVSIIIPVYNEAKYIEGCLNSVESFDYPLEYLEVIVVDGNSTDNTRELVDLFIKKNKNFHLVVNTKKIVPISMNIGIQKAKGDFIIRLDAHSFYPTNYVSELISKALLYESDNIGTVCLTEVKSVTSKSSSIKFVLSNKYGVGNSLFRVGVNKPVEVDTVPFGCFKRSILDKVGGYDERLIRNQDIEINKRIKKVGGKIILLPEPKCVYFARETYKPFAKNNFLNGKWNILTGYYTNDLSSLSLRHYIPLLFVLSIMFPLFLIPFDSKFLILSSLILCLYFFSISLISIYQFKLSRITLFSIFSFAILHFSYGFGSFVGLISVFFNKLNYNNK